MTKDEIELYECVRNLNEEYSDDFIYHMDKLYSNITDKEEFINRLSKLMKIIFINYDVKISKCFLTLLNNKLFEMNITEDRYYKKLNKYNI